MPETKRTRRDEVDRLAREVDALREETSLQAAIIEGLEAENERLHALLAPVEVPPHYNA